MTVAVNDANGHLPWSEKMLQPFDSVQIGIRPQPWCRACSKADNKACGQTMYNVLHELKKCAVCGQKVTTAHLHLYYIGHAQLTRRLITVDPAWRWEPMARDITQPELVAAAIATGNPEIVRMILDSFPPKMTELEVSDGRGGTRIEYGMWIRLILHGDDGREIPMIGFGDAKGKLWGGDALKEIIGDALRNAAMRRGAALGLWESQDLEQAEKERQQFNPDDPRGGENARAALFDDPSAVGAGKPPADPPDKEGQAAIDLAWQICQRDGDPGDAIEEIRVKIAEPARKKRGQLAAKVRPPWSKNPDERLPLSAAFTHVKNVLLSRQDAQALAARQGQDPAEAADIINATGA